VLQEAVQVLGPVFEVVLPEDMVDEVLSCELLADLHSLQQQLIGCQSLFQS